MWLLPSWEVRSARLHLTHEGGIHCIVVELDEPAFLSLRLRRQPRERPSIEPGIDGCDTAHRSPLETFAADADDQRLHVLQGRRNVPRPPVRLPLPRSKQPMTPARPHVRPPSSLPEGPAAPRDASDQILHEVVQIAFGMTMQTSSGPQPDVGSDEVIGEVRPDGPGFTSEDIECPLRSGSGARNHAERCIQPSFASSPMEERRASVIVARWKYPMPAQIDARGNHAR